MNKIKRRSIKATTAGDCITNESTVTYFFYSFFNQSFFKIDYYKSDVYYYIIERQYCSCLVDVIELNLTVTRIEYITFFVY